jgi:hypothetical protein
MKPTVEIVTATPKLIKELRALDTHNRRRKKTHVDYLRNEIRAGRFSLTNQGIGVTVSGYICDGGHRLEAIELEGYPPVQFILVRGLPDSAQKYVDQHAKRSMGDTLSLFFDLSMSNTLVAMLNVFIRMVIGDNIRKIGPDMLIEQYQLRENHIQQLLSVANARTLSAPVLAALLEAFWRTNDTRVLTFAEQVIRGELLQAGDPAFTLRRWLEACPSGGAGSQQRERYFKTQSAVSAFLEGRRITKLYATDNTRQQ